MSIELGDQQIVHFLEDQEGLLNEEDLPRRVAISPWFNVPLGRRDELGDELRIIARRWKPVTADIEGEEYIGRRHRLPVTMIGAETLRAFTYNLMNAVSRVGGVARASDFTDGHYRPYIIPSYRDSLPVDLKQVKIDNFSLVETTDNPAANRAVVATYKLEGIK